MHTRTRKESASTLALNTLAARGKGEAVKNMMRKLEKP